jgi:hypothetical protein
MSNFKYEYIKVNDIFNNIKLIKDFSIIELSLLVFLLVLFIVSIYLILPYIYFYYKFILEKIKKKRKIYLLKQISLEREIEAEMQKEMEQH